MIDPEEIREIFIQARISSALALGLSWPDGQGGWRTRRLFLGRPSLFSDEQVDERTVFDLASLTKVLVTSLCLHDLVVRGKVAFSDALVTLLPEIAKIATQTALPALRQITIGQLLSHSSGLAAHRPFYSRLLALSPVARKDALLAMIMAERPIYDAGCDHIYSDLGFMLLGFIIERLTGESLDAYWRRVVAEKIGVANDLFFPGRTPGQHVFAETGVCPWSGKILAGIVHDDNCRSLGGIAGHAGLFGTLGGVLAACDWLVAAWHGRRGMAQETAILRQMSRPMAGSSRCLGFDSPSGPDSASGQYFRAPSIGHLGFTGTSLWIDLERQISLVLLTNRTIYSWEREPMTRFRRRIYDSVMRAFEGWPENHPSNEREDHHQQMV
jgi:CubicO group peptidase (beta-lactamase class C family)